MRLLRRLLLGSLVVLIGFTGLSVSPETSEAQGYGKPRARRPGCLLQVTNKTPWRVLIHIDGVYWGWVNAHNVFTFTGIAAGPTVLYGTTQYGEYFWGPNSIRCSGTSTWLLSQ
jgi:hypothetical protein